MSEASHENLAGYPLQRAFISSIRLYFQHWMWRRQLGYLLHPDIPVRDDIRVADVACGTGIWLLDLAKDNPSARLDGFDISPAQFPHTGLLPQNVTLSTLNILEPIPHELRGQYDIVHVGLLVLVVEKDDPLPLLDNLLAMLKPGGYLQWDEADFGGLHVDSPNVDVPHNALDELKRKVLGLLLATKGTTFSWARELDKSFRERHLSILGHRNIPINDDIALPWTLQHLMASTELISNIDRPPGTATEWWRLYNEAAEEVTRGACMRMAMISIAGQKRQWPENVPRCHPVHLRLKSTEPISGRQRALSF